MCFAYSQVRTIYKLYEQDFEMFGYGEVDKYLELAKPS